MADVTEVDVVTGKVTEREYTAKERAEVLRIRAESALSPQQKRLVEYPPAGDQLDAEFKARQKRKMLVGKARAALDIGDFMMALTHLLEAAEPTDEQDMLDGKIMSVKTKYPEGG